MKQSDVLKVLSLELGTSKLDEVNKALKAKNYSTKFRITGPTLVHFGFTGLIKALAPEGVKVYNVNKVSLIRYEDIDSFAKAKPREERKVHTPKAASKTATEAKVASLKQKAKPLIEDEDYENDDDFDELADEADDVIENESFKTKLVEQEQKPKKKRLLHVPGSGSQFIPKKK